MHSYFKVARSFHSSRHKYDLQPVIESPSDFQIDCCFVDTLIDWGTVNLSEIGLFINYHYECSQQKDFVDYTLDLLEDKREELKQSSEERRELCKDFPQIYDEAISWLNNPTSTPSKDDPSFQEIFKNTEDAHDVFLKCQQKKFIGSDGKWQTKEKSYLVALAYHLRDCGYLEKSYKNALLGRVFSKRFQFTISERSFNNDPKADYFEDFRIMFPDRS